MQIIDGKKISQEIKDEVKEEVAQLKAEGKDIALAVIQVGADPASSVYVRNKKRACEYVGIESVSYELPEETTQEELMAIVDKCNKDPKINGILVQLPLPKHLDEDEVLLAIDPKKDVDGFSSSQCWKYGDRRKRILTMHTSRSDPVIKTFWCRN